MSTPLRDRFKVIKGSEALLEFHFFDQFGNPEDLANDATGNAVISATQGGAAILTKVLNIEPDARPGVAQFSITDAESAALAVGLPVVRAVLDINGNTHLSEYHFIEVVL